MRNKRKHHVLKKITPRPFESDIHRFLCGRNEPHPVPTQVKREGLCVRCERVAKDEH